MLSSLVLRIVFGIIFLSIIDALGHYGIKHLFQTKRQTRIRRILLRLHWLVTFAVLVWVIILIILKGNPASDYISYRSYQSLTGFILFVYGPKMIFALFSFLQYLLNLIKAIFSRKRTAYLHRSNPNRKKTSNALVKFSLPLSILMMFFIGKGILFDRNRTQIHEIEFASDKIPASFDGFQITLISDIHMGSFYNKKTPQKLKKLIQSTNPDILLCAGDMVNTSPNEVLKFISEFSKIETEHGKYSVLGNHDLDDYSKTDRYDIDTSKIEELISLQQYMGFRVLIDEHIYLKKGNDSIALIGVRNWGLPPFVQYGNFAKSVYNLDTSSFSILLSHDPSHWTSEVIPNSNVDLTLSGHTHALQMGLSLFGRQWSPISLLYPQWYGLYQREGQSLFVSKGLGFIGYPGRIGMLPEIVVIKLKAP